MFIIDKIFNLKIDTKNKNISTVTGFKQFDNNSILNIILLQNNLALDLTNCTVRLNFKREDDRVLLYMASIVSAREGKLSIKLSPEVLKCTGNIEADISVFDSNLLKITSTTFNMKVDKAIYNNDTYFTDKDLDLMQQEYIKERERESNENIRKSNETTRITKENQRNSNENTRISNEEARKKAENTRVDEWNNVKKDATNIKNTLNATIDTANNTNSALKNTIASGDKLKSDLNTKNYVKNEDYEKHKKEVTAQYEEITKDIKENATKTVIKETNILTLDSNVEGMANISVGGNTVENLISNSKINESSSKYGFGIRKISKELVAGKEYTLIVNGRVDQKTLDTHKNLQCFIYNIGRDSWSDTGGCSIVSLSNITKMIKFIPKFTRQYEIAFYLYANDGDRTGKVTANWAMLLEGDWTNKPIPDHFDGIKSVGELEENKIEIKSVGKNLFDINSPEYFQSETHDIKNNKLTITSTKLTIASIVRYTLKLKQNTNYTFSAKSTRTGNSGGNANILSKNTGEYLYTTNSTNPNFTFNTLNNSNIYIYLYGEFGTKTGSSATYWDIQLEEGDKATTYEPYIEDKVVYTLKAPLRSLPNGARDVLNTDGTVTRKIGKVVLNGYEDWSVALNSANTREHFYTQPKNKNGKKGAHQVLMCDNFIATIASWTLSELNTVSTSNANCFQIGFTFNKSTYTEDTWKQYLKKNPVTVLYELKEPVTEKVGEPLILKTWGNGNIQVNTDIPPYLKVDYTSNLNSRINSLEESSSIIKSNLGGAWRTLLILADKELRMKTITPLTTKDVISNKINEMIGAWR